jgi:hypothetical protein
MLACINPVQGVLHGHVCQVCVVGVGVEGVDISDLGS